MKKTLITLIIATSALSIANGALAAVGASGLMGKDSGFYAGVNVGSANADWKKSDLSQGAATIKDKSGTTYGVDVGYMFNSNIGLEVAYDMYADTKGIAANGTEFSRIKKQNFLSFSSVFNVPFAAMWNVFAKLGIVHTGAELAFTDGFPSNKSNAWAPVAGLGAAYNVMSNISVNAQAKYIMKTDSKKQGYDLTVSPKYTALTVGVNYKF